MTTLRFKAVRFIVLGAAGLGVSWWFYSSTIAPLEKRKEEFLQRRADLRHRVVAGRLKLVAIKDAEQKLGTVRTNLNRLVGDNSGESPMVAFPADVAYHFAQLGFPSAVVRLATIEPDKDIADYDRIYWSIGLPIPMSDHSLKALLVAIANLEELDRLIKVTDFSVQPDSENPAQRNASIGVVILARHEPGSR